MGEEDGGGLGGGGGEGDGLVRGASSRIALSPSPPVRPRLTLAAKFWLALGAVGVGVVIGTADSPGHSAAVTAAALAPALATFAAIRSRLPDPAVTTSFLVVSAFLLGIPGIVAVSIIELIVAIAGIAAVFGASLRPLLEEYLHGEQALEGKAGDPRHMTPEQQKAFRDGMAALWDRIRAEIPLWKLVLAVLVLAFAVAALTEELAKYIVARRHRKLLADGIGTRGVVACAAAAALGLAATEHLMYALGYLDQMSFGAALLESAYRALVAFPLHVGTGFYIGTRMARHAVLMDPRISLLKTIAVPVLFHGSLDSFAFFAAAESDSVPLLSYLAVPFNFVLIVLLGRVCRRNYRDVVEREAALSSLEAFDTMTVTSTDAAEPQDVV